jgi:hypothetical protein
MAKIYEKINSYVNVYVVRFNLFDMLHSLTDKSEKNNLNLARSYGRDVSH